MNNMNGQTTTHGYSNSEPPSEKPDPIAEMIELIYSDVELLHEVVVAYAIEQTRDKS